MTSPKHLSFVLPSAGISCLAGRRETEREMNENESLNTLPPQGNILLDLFLFDAN